MTDLYRNQLRIVLQGFSNTMSDMLDLTFDRERIKYNWVNKYSDITIEEINNRIKELENGTE